MNTYHREIENLNKLLREALEKIEVSIKLSQDARDKVERFLESTKINTHV